MNFYQYAAGEFISLPRAEGEAVPTDKTFPQFAFQYGYSPQPTAILGDQFADIHIQVHNLDTDDPEKAHEFLLQMFVGSQTFGIFVEDLPHLMRFVNHAGPVLELAMASQDRDELRVHQTMHRNAPDSYCRYCTDEPG